MTTETLFEWMGKLAVVGGIATIISAIINRITSKQIQNKIASQNDSIERLKSELTIRVSRQGKIYERRVEIIDEVRRMLIEIQRDFRYMIGVKGFGVNEKNRKTQVESEEALRKHLEEFDVYILTITHYFKKTHGEMLIKISETLRVINNDYLRPGFLVKISDGKILDEEYTKSLTGMIKAANSVNDIITSFISQLDDEFRKLLGVED